MKNRIINNNDELIQKAVSILLEKLGPADTNRFLTILPQDRIDSVKRHQQWQDKLNKKVFFKEIFEDNKKA